MYDFTKPKQKTLPVKLKNGKIIVLLPPNGYVLEAISEMQAAEETEAVKNIYSVFQQLLNKIKNGFKISRNDVLSYDVEEIKTLLQTNIWTLCFPFKKAKLMLPYYPKR